MNFAWAGLGDLMAGRHWTPPGDGADAPAPQSEVTSPVR
jgi:hypothetical protein